MRERQILFWFFPLGWLLNSSLFRLLMPSFNHNDIIFPVDGPLGRCGPSLRSTLECPLSDPDWPRCSVQQMVLRDQRHWLTKLCALVPDQVAWRTLLHAVMSFKPSMPLPPVKLPPRCLAHAHRRVHPPETNPADGKGYSYARGMSRRFGYDHSTSAYRSHETRLMSGDSSDKQQDEFLPEYLRPPKDTFDDEPRFTDSPSLPNYLGNPNSIYRLRPHKSGSYGSSETSTTGSSSSSHHYNGYFKNSGTSPKSPPLDTEGSSTKSAESTDGKNFMDKCAAKEPQLDQLSPTYSKDYVGYSTVSDWPPEALLTNEEKCAIKLSQIFGWRKAVRVVKKHPRVRVVSRLVDFALVEPDEEDDDKPGEDVINYTDLVSLLKGPEVICVGFP
ncbi:hypothetical protein COOONC_05700 [Cooperia oncophora]